MIYRMLSRQYASGFVKGTLFGLQARPFTSTNFKHTQENGTQNPKATA